MKLEKLLKPLNLDWVNPDINSQNFPYVEMPKGNLELFILKEAMTGLEIEKKVIEQGLRLATIHELLIWLKDNPKEVGWFFALGSRWTDPSGRVDVPYAYVLGADRGFFLYWFAYRFYSFNRVLVSRPGKSPLDSGTLGSSELLDTSARLETDKEVLNDIGFRLNKVEDQIAKILKVLNV